MCIYVYIYAYTPYAYRDFRWSTVRLGSDFYYIPAALDPNDMGEPGPFQERLLSSFIRGLIEDDYVAFDTLMNRFHAAVYGQGLTL